MKKRMINRHFMRLAALMSMLLILLVAAQRVNGQSTPKTFDVMETSIDQIHAAYKSGQLTSTQLVKMYLSRIDAYDQKGPTINSIITINSKALDEAAELDAEFKKSGFVGPLHGIPVLIKDQIDVKGMPTTLGSIMLKNYYPENDAFVVAKLKKAGAIILGKTTLGEFGGGDAYGSLFGATHNPYALDRTSGGSSGGNGAALSSNFATVAVGEEISSSIRRPSTWNSIVGMRPTVGMISRTGMYDGWPSINGSLGPMARNVADLAKLLDTMIGYDPDDPLTATGYGKAPPTFTKFLDKSGLKGARIGILREPFGTNSEPDSEDFKKVTAVFDKAVGELEAAGATVVDPIVIPDLKKLLATRVNGEDSDEDIKWYFRYPNAPFKSRADLLKSPDFAKLTHGAQQRLKDGPQQDKWYKYLAARQELTINIMKVMADNKLDAIVHKSVEHQPTLISQGINPPYISSKGAQTMATFLVFVPVIAVPAGFTTDNLPVGITFMGRAYSDATMIKLAYAYEQATHHRKPPQTVPRLPH